MKLEDMAGDIIEKIEIVTEEQEIGFLLGKRISMRLGMKETGEKHQVKTTFVYFMV